MSKRALFKNLIRQTVGTVEQTVGTTLQILDGRYMENSRTGVQIMPVRLTLPRLAPEFHGYRMVQISDIHMDPDLTPEHLSSAVEIINELEPDLVAITGDFVTEHGAQYEEGLVASLSGLHPRDASVAVPGNHDYPPWSDMEIIPRVLERSGIINLTNTIYTLKRGEAMLHIAGVDDMTRGEPRLDLVLEQLPQRGVAILLSHAPDFADISSQTGRFALQLSGHTHGGQIALPVFGARVFPINGKKYRAGCYQVNGMYQYTNRGLGLGHPRIRFNCPAEITLLTLLSPSAR